MFSSSSITPAEPRRDQATLPTGSPSRSRTVITWALLATWAALLTFGVVALGDPQWLSEMAEKGRKTEADAYLHLGDNELRKGNLGLAIAQYVHALTIRPDQPAVLLNLGFAYLRQGDVARAEAALQRAARLETTTRMKPFISMHLAEAAEKRDRPDEAILYYEQALREGGRHDLVYRQLGTIYLAQKDLVRAQDAFTKVLTAQSDPLLPYAKMLDRTQESAQQDSVASRWLATAGSGKLSDADWQRYDGAMIEIMLARDPEIAKTHNHLGLIAHLRGDNAAAALHFEQSLAIWPDNTDAVRNLRIVRANATATPSRTAH